MNQLEPDQDMEKVTSHIPESLFHLSECIINIAPWIQPGSATDRK
jgi:hypothetical protein